ncbi:SURF1 family protein [Paeniglutamicibacter cryotolerans]|uniref:SURF1-like protein n=1 Tax=Paeniglutamicibacter cryotolerans TaxID=670079 RepID=A0A839QZB4_9MICC|nr:SURF1 family protein [Paeniglutamicibacter cryotolerans]MBB2997311.1 cytochrome oxidase assembly protein ShyY1 [Paeniglutamicibacter cryotolerans]
MYRFLASTRWLGWLLIACVFAAGCVFLGRWQMDRLAGVKEEIRHVQVNYDAAPLTYAQAAPLLDHLPEDGKWTQVALTGKYAIDDTVIVRNRPRSGNPGYEVLVPFHVKDGGTVIVNRGWLPIGNEHAGNPDVVPAPQSGTVQIVVRLKSGEPKVSRGAPAGQLASIELPAMAQLLDYPIHLGAYGLMATESPAAATAPDQIEKPEADEGSHLSYAFQWFTFGLLAFFGLGYAAKQQARLNREDKEVEEAAVASGIEVDHSAYRAPRQRKTRRRDGSLTDEALEDAYLDAVEDKGRPGS